MFLPSKKLLLWNLTYAEFLLEMSFFQNAERKLQYIYEVIG